MLTASKNAAIFRPSSWRDYTGQYRWDPSRSMKLAAQSIVDADREKPVAEQKYADITTVTDANYFPIVSAERLGTEQTAQFQSDDQTGAAWHWGSKCTAAGTCDSEATPANNELAEMPREYETQRLNFGRYNWYAATAESGKWLSPFLTDVNDSICPKGWMLPQSGQLNDSTVKSWDYLLAGAYGLINQAGTQTDSNSPFGIADEAYRRMRSLPLNMPTMFYAGYYSFIQGTTTVDAIHYWTKTYAGLRGRAYALRFYSTYVSPSNNPEIITGSVIRCVMK